MRHIYAAALVAGLLLASSAPVLASSSDTLAPDAPLAAPSAPGAADLVKPSAPTVTFDVVGATITAPTPPGYCDPIGTAAKLAVLMQNIAEQGHFEAPGIWVGCNLRQDDPATVRLALLATVPKALPVGLTRTQFVQQLATALGSAKTQAAVQDLAKKRLADVDSAAGENTKTTLQSPLTLAATDADAVYIRVQAVTAKGPVSVQLRVIEGLTLVNHRLVMIAFAKMAAQSDPDDDLLAQAKAEIARIQSQPSP